MTNLLINATIIKTLIPEILSFYENNKINERKIKRHPSIQDAVFFGGYLFVAISVHLLVIRYCWFFQRISFLQQPRNTGLNI